MSRTDFDLLTTAPAEETPVEGDIGAAKTEGRRYINLLVKVLGPPPTDSQLKVRTNLHDLGSYVSVVYFFDDEDESHIEYMRRLDGEGPLNWEGT